MTSGRLFQNGASAAVSRAQTDFAGGLLQCPCHFGHYETFLGVDFSGLGADFLAAEFKDGESENADEPAAGGDNGQSGVRGNPALQYAADWRNSKKGHCKYAHYAPAFGVVHEGLEHGIARRGDGDHAEAYGYAYQVGARGTADEGNCGEGGAEEHSGEDNYAPEPEDALAGGQIQGGGERPAADAAHEVAERLASAAEFPLGEGGHKHGKRQSEEAENHKDCYDEPYRAHVADVREALRYVAHCPRALGAARRRDFYHVEGKENREITECVYEKADSLSDRGYERPSYRGADEAGSVYGGGIQSDGVAEVGGRDEL